MKINCNVKGTTRKELAGIIGQAVGIEPVYMKVPTCAYAIGDITLNRTGEMIWDERTDEATIEKVKEAIVTAGFMLEGEATETPKGAQEQKVVEQETEPKEPASIDAQLETVALTVSVPLARHSGNSLRNLINLVYTRAGLINKALGTSLAAEQGLIDALAENENLRTLEDFRKAVAAYEAEHGIALSGITITEEKITFSSMPETSDPDTIKAFTELTAMMNKQALTQKRIQAKTMEVDNEKYALRIWLTRLGMNGSEYKTTRKILMKNLSGHCAFRTEAEKERWMEKQAAKRKAAKEVSA